MVLRIPPMKHILQDDIDSVDMGTTVQSIDLAVGTINPNPFVTPYSQVKAGSYITKIHFVMGWTVDPSQQAVSSAVRSILKWHVIFNINGTQTLPPTNDLGSSHIKNQIFRTGSAIFNYQTGNFTLNTNSQPGELRRCEYDFVLAIPRQYQQINAGDKITLRWQFWNYAAGADPRPDKNFSGTFIYKEIFP